MAEMKKNGFKTVETNYEERDEQIRVHRKKLALRIVEVVLMVVVLIAVVQLLYALRRFDSYEIRNYIERSNSDATQFAEYNDYIIEYSNDGISCVTHSREPIWNQSYEMTTPELDICGEYLVVYDRGGTSIYILNDDGLQKQLEMTTSIQEVCIAKQGTIAVLMRNGTEAQVKLYDKKGSELANGRFYGDNGGFPIDIALSHDATKLAVDMIDVSQGTVNTTISFYNFGSVGQSEIDNNVGTYTYEGLLIPEVDYVSDSKMIALGTGKLLIYEGSQKPSVSQEITFEQEILSFFHNDKYVGIVYDNLEKENAWHIKVLDYKGNTIMENDTTVAYDQIEFLSNNEICVTNETDCEIFTIHSIKKFSYVFDKPIYKIISRDGGQNYTFIFKETTEEVKLK